jgi:putative ABC transport system permease protein
MFDDIRYGLRRLGATPGFTLLAMVTLGIGIGGATAIFSAVNPVLFASLPYPRPDRIVSIDEVHENGTHSDGTFAMFRQYVERAHTFESIAVWRTWGPSASGEKITGDGRPERLDGQRVSADYFRVLGVAPRIGRGFQPADDGVNGPRVAILSDALWRRRFDADPAIVGRDIRLDDTLYTVIGIMPARFENVALPAAGVWTALQYDPAIPPNGREWGHHLKTIARLRPGVQAADASRDVMAIGRSLMNRVHPATYDPTTGFAVVPLRDELASGVKPALRAILGAVGLVLLMACVNVTNLVLARGARRRGEFALRIALGAGRLRLIRQVLTENILLAIGGGAVGVALASFGVSALVALSPPGLPRAGAIAVNTPVLIFAAAVSVLIGVVFGMFPALQATRRDPHVEIQTASPRTAGGRRRTPRALVVGEVALALVLLVSSGLLFRSLTRLFAVPLGFDPRGVLTLQVQAVGRRYNADGEIERLYERQLDAVRRVPGIVSAGFSSQLPLSGDRDQYGARFPATPSLPEDTFGAYRYAVSPGYLESLRIPLIRGRAIDDRDVAAAPRVAVISESLAKARFGDRSPLGQEVRIGPDIAFTIVGVVGDVRQASLASDNPQAVYLHAAQSWFPDSPRSFVVSANADAAALAPSVRDAIWSIDKDQPISRVAMLRDLIAASASERRFALMLFEAFAMIALVLATVGIYGVLAGSVADRTREIGVRLALGATRGEIVSLIVRQGMTLTALGLAIGLGGAAVATRALVTLLFGVSPLDPVTYAGGVSLLVLASAIACWIPAVRAARVDPAVTLRAE